MPVETPSLFAAVIQEHLELKRRNSALEHEMPLDRYLTVDPFENHPLFKTEEQARIEETMDGIETIQDQPTSLDWPTLEEASIDTAGDRADIDETREAAATDPPSDESLWSRSRDFDWGD